MRVRGFALRRMCVDLLTHLVEKSLVILEVSGDRYRMLDTVRHYAQEKLDESKESEAVRVQHHEFYLALAEEARPELAGPAQAHWLESARPRARQPSVGTCFELRPVTNGAADGLRMIFALTAVLDPSRSA